MTAIVTGASSGIGKACALKLLELNYKVIGLCRTSSIDDKNFRHVCVDLTNLKDIRSLKDYRPHVLINCAGVGYFAPHEELSYEQMTDMITVNLTAAILITKQNLRSLKKNAGYIFNINSISAIQPAIFGAVYGATKAGLKHFGTSLYKEARKSGLKVININPDITNTPFFDNLSFEPVNNNPLTYIEPSDIANLIEEMLKIRKGTVITDITIEPQLFQILKKR